MGCGFDTLKLSAAACALVVAVTSASADERRDNSVRSAAIKIMQTKLGPLRGTIPITARKTLLTTQMIEQLKPIPKKAFRVGPGIDPITTDSVTPFELKSKQSFPAMDFNELLAGN